MVCLTDWIGRVDHDDVIHAVALLADELGRVIHDLDTPHTQVYL
jgi:hypothetical protein